MSSKYSWDNTFCNQLSCSQFQYKLLDDMVQHTYPAYLSNNLVLKCAISSRKVLNYVEIAVS